MPENLYYVQPGDSLFLIAGRFGTTVEALLAANVICNPNLIFIGQVLVIPRPGLDLPKAGGSPYYVVLPGDTLFCLARQFNTTVRVLAAINQLANPNLIFAGSELLIGPDIPDPVNLKKTWEQTADQFCGRMNSLQIHGIYYIGSFQWAALGRRAIPFLLELLDNPCDTVRFHAVLSLGRIAIDEQVKQALTRRLEDTPEIAGLAELAIRRIELARLGRGRVHLTTANTYLAEEPFLNAPASPLPKGTEVIVIRWHIPSPTGEDLPPGGLVIWDQVRVVGTGQTGFLLRVGYSEVEFV